jgi:hypothetical protein
MNDDLPYDDRFDQCGATTTKNGYERCSMEAEHSGPHSFEIGMEEPEPEVVGYHGTKVEAAVKAVTEHRVKKVEADTGASLAGTRLRDLLEAETREWVQIVVPILAPEPDERGAEEREAAP